MEIGELQQRIASEPERTVVQRVWTLPQVALSKATSGGVRLTDLLAVPGRCGFRAT
jgi:hypothetical protein